MWQVSGRSEINFKGRLEMDSWYVKNWSVWIDMVYIVKTVKAVLLRKGAY
jgi:undecaprenyl-phosphate galactose phosphotransferase